MGALPQLLFGRQAAHVCPDLSLVESFTLRKQSFHPCFQPQRECMADVRDVPGTAMYGPESARLQGTSSRLPNTVSWTSPLPETPLSGQSSSLPADTEYKETEAQDPGCLFAVYPNSSRNNVARRLVL